MTSISAQEKRKRFRALHADGFFVLPNPWDVGSAVRFAAMGFKALASTSSGAAATLGRKDYELERDEVLRHLEDMSAATEVPLNADFEGGFAANPSELAANVALAIKAGVSGLSIEDRSGLGLYALPVALDRLRAARQAIDRSGEDVLLIARTEAFLVGETDITMVIERMRALADAGADCLYAPGLRMIDQVSRLVDAVKPKPVNVLLWEGLAIGQLRDAGVRRVSTGGALANAAHDAGDAAARAILDLEAP